MSKMDPGGSLWQLEEDLADCIAAWQESSHTTTGEFPRIQAPRSPMRTVTSASGRKHDTCGAEFLSFGPREPLGPVLAVNVGDSNFKCTASTLRKSPYLEVLLDQALLGHEGAGGRFDENGQLFIDRSGELFGYILEFLRSGHWLLRDRASDLEFIDALREEASFYGLSSGDRLLPRISEYVTVWQFRDDTSIYVDCFEQTIREDPDHQGLFRLCKYSGSLPLDQQTCTRRFKVTSHSVQSALAYFAMRGFSLQHVIEGCTITHTTSADGQSRSGQGTQYVLSRLTVFPAPVSSATPTPIPPRS
mmetsp:Transcript_16746/g.37760  ORF Transcript_16746/g.37760 Transcript_16746/m.37760 type:complete len:304 (+) Transcript_16746:121-1032(+)